MCPACKGKRSAAHSQPPGFGCQHAWRSQKCLYNTQGGAFQASPLLLALSCAHTRVSELCHHPSTEAMAGTKQWKDRNGVGQLMLEQGRNPSVGQSPPLPPVRALRDLQTSMRKTWVSQCRKNQQDIAWGFGAGKASCPAVLPLHPRRDDVQQGRGSLSPPKTEHHVSILRLLRNRVTAKTPPLPADSLGLMQPGEVRYQSPEQNSVGPAFPPRHARCPHPASV